MLDYSTEERILSNGFLQLGAIDEAGRGPLAGPVVAACVLCRPGLKITPEMEKIKDSKKLTPKKREELFQVINDIFPEIGVGISAVETIDRVNVLQATFLAMKKAIGALRNKPDFLVIDGNFPIPNISIQQKPIIKGDSLVFSIAAASIIAKVTRDRIMMENHEKYPEYGFDKHKGYGTKVHLEMIQKHGFCSIHRKSFSPIKEMAAKQRISC